MFRNILVPTDGSRRSAAAIERAVRLAKEQGGRVTAVHIAPPPPSVIMDDGASMRYRPPRQAGVEARRTSRKYLQEAKQTAAELNVPCSLVSAVSERPYDEILRIARREKCDLICMASHGRTGLSKLLLGSQTAKVLALSRVPVLVIR